MNQQEDRYFIAIPIPLSMKEMFQEWRGRHQHSLPFRRWVYVDDYHITLQYLGACKLSLVEQVKQELAKIASEFASFELRLSGLGTFGRREQPRILWAGVEGDLDALHKLQQRVVSGMQILGFLPESRPYRPHVTIARQYEGERFDEKHIAGIWVQEMAFPAWQVTSVILYRTQFGKQPMYVNEGEFELKEDLQL